MMDCISLRCIPAFFVGWMADLTPEYPTEIYTKVTYRQRKNIKRPLDRLEI